MWPKSNASFSFAVFFRFSFSFANSQRISNLLTKTCLSKYRPPLVTDSTRMAVAPVSAVLYARTFVE